MISIWTAIGGILVALGVGGLCTFLWVARQVDIKPWR